MMDSRNTAHPAWLTSRRLRVHGLIRAICPWSTYAWILSSPGLLDRNRIVKGADFLHFYTLGSLAREHRSAQLYDMEAQSTMNQERLPQVSRVRLVPLYGPQVSLFFAPLSKLPYSQALLVWLLLNAAIYALCCYALWKKCPNLQSESMLVFILALAYPGFFHLIAWGQTSGLALACFTAAYLALRSQRCFLAGLALGCLVFKPQLGLATVFVILAPAYLLLADWIVADGTASARNLGMLLYLGYALPLFGPLSIWTHLQLSVPAMAAILWMIFRATESQTEAVSHVIAAEV